MNTLPVLLKFKQDYEPPEDLVKMQILIQQVCISNKHWVMLTLLIRGPQTEY